MDFPCKVGITMPDEIKDRYETEPREYLIGSRCKGIWGVLKGLQYDSRNLGYALKKIIYANVNIVGF